MTKAMNDFKGASLLATNIILGIFGWISWTVVIGWLQVLSLITSIVVGIFAIRFYNSGHKKNKNGSN